MANINKQERQQLYEWFETGDRPSQLEFQDFIDSMIIQDDDEVWVENDDPSYLNYLGIGTTSPVGRVSISGETVIGAGFSSDRSIPSTHLPDDGLVVEGDVKIGTHNNRDYRMEIKSRTSTNANTGHQRPLLINSANHTMMVFNDEDGTSTDPFTIIDEKGFGVKFWKFAPGSATGSHTLVYMAPDGKMGVHNDNPIAKVDINAFGDAGIRVDTQSSDAMILEDTSSNPNSLPFSFREEANRGFRFMTQSNEHLRITAQGNVEVQGGHIQGKRDAHTFNIHSNSNANDGSYLELAPLNSDPLSDHQGQIAFVSVGKEEKSGFRFFQHDPSLPSWKVPFKIEANGNVGINRQSNLAENLLDIDSSGTDTGLRLRKNAGNDKVLVSDTDGNANWKALGSDFNDGDWDIKANGDIYNLNSKVGVGTDDPHTKVHIKSGNAPGLKIETESSDALIFADSSGGNTPFTFVESANRGFRFFTGATGNAREHLRIQQDGTIDIGSYSGGGSLTVKGHTQSDSVEVIGGGAHTGLTLPTGSGAGKILTSDSAGHGVWTDLGANLNDGDWLFNGGNIYNNTHKVGIGTNAPVGKLDVHGEIRVSGKKPFIFKRIKFGQDNLGSTVGNTVTGGTGVKFDEYAAAITGFATNEVAVRQDGLKGKHLMVYMMHHAGYWHVRADIRSYRANPEEWYIDVMFVRRELVDDQSPNDWGWFN